jgi:hypothetical protein
MHNGEREDWQQEKGTGGTHNELLLSLSESHSVSASLDWRLETGERPSFVRRASCCHLNTRERGERIGWAACSKETLDKTCYTISLCPVLAYFEGKGERERLLLLMRGGERDESLTHLSFLTC